MKTIRKNYPQRSSAISKCHLGVGVDIEYIDRFRMLNKVRHRSFLKMIFTKKEQSYCFSRKDPAPHLAARFCAKEAIVKALGSMGIHKVAYSKIEIVKNAKGVPQVIFHIKGKKFQIQISISHARDYAIACAVILQK